MLQFLYCAGCEYYVHPAGPICPECLSERLEPKGVSGRGSVFSYTINYQQWGEEPIDPYVIAIVEMEEQAGLQLTTNIVECDPMKVAIGMAVRVKFEQLRDVYLPVFVPDAG